jgi:hypothetical protein
MSISGFPKKKNCIFRERVALPLELGEDHLSWKYTGNRVKVIRWNETFRVFPKNDCIFRERVALPLELGEDHYPGNIPVTELR